MQLCGWLYNEPKLTLILPTEPEFSWVKEIKTREKEIIKQKEDLPSTKEKANCHVCRELKRKPESTVQQKKKKIKKNICNQ